jgi:hypothetical protein
MASRKQKELPEENKEAIKRYRWLWLSPLLTIPTAIFIFWEVFDWVATLFCSGHYWDCRYSTVDMISYGFAILGSALWHLVLLNPTRDNRRVLVRWHRRQALALAGLRTVVPFLTLSSAYLWGDSPETSLLFAISILSLIWLFGTLWGQNQAARGECSLARWLGRADELPPKPAKAPMFEKESVLELSEFTRERLVEVIRFSDDQQLRKDVMQKYHEGSFVAQVFFDAQGTPETSASVPKIDVLLQTIRNSPNKQKRDAAFAELDRLGIVGML